MAYTILAFHYYRVTLHDPGLEYLPPIVERLDEEAVRIAQGIYVLSLEKHKELIEWATQTLKQHEHEFACLSAIPDPERPLMWHTRDTTQQQKMDAWLENHELGGWTEAAT